MADKKISELNGGVLVNPAMGDRLLLETLAGGNSRGTDFTRVAGLLDKQSDRYLIQMGNFGGLRLMSAKWEPELNAADATIEDAIPPGSLLLGVTTFINALLTGSLTSLDIGIPGDITKFGTNVSIAANTAHRGIIAPMPISASTDIVLTANGGAGASNTGKISIVAYYLLWDIPTA